MKGLYLAILSVLFVSWTLAQSYQQEFNQLFSEKDTTGQREILEKWERAVPNDPELIVSWYNYYFSISQQEILTIGNDPKGEESLKMTDSAGNAIGYFYGNTIYESESLDKAFSKIAGGIQHFPNRLDMRFGYAYGLLQVKDYESFTKVLEETIHYSIEINNKWKWMNNESVDHPKDFMLASIQDYQGMLFEAEDDVLLQYMKRIAEAVLSGYPEHVESYSNLSLVEILRGNYDDAIVQLNKALKIKSKDVIVLNNMAYAYKMKGNKKKAIEYYELVIKYGDKNDQFLAREEIQYLKDH